MGRTLVELDLLSLLRGILWVPHRQQLRKCLRMPDEVIPTDTLDIQDTLEYREHPIRILGRDTKETRSKTIPMCKIQWSNHTEREATWEKESDLRLRYPYLFEEYVTL